MRPVCAALVAGLLGAGCAAAGTVHDGTSVSWGRHNSGRLLNPARLPIEGDGYRIPPTWAVRGMNHGTDELVSLVVRAARRVEAELPGSTLFVGNLSPARGGPSRWHRSHQSGRDVDLMFFALDEQGRPAGPPDAMYVFGPDGWTLETARGRPQPRLQFDAARNWLLVRALLEDPLVEVQYLFISEGLRDLLVEHAIAIGEPPHMVHWARSVLHQPTDSLPHDDHLHVRILCPPSDRVLGCRDVGPLRWLKKGYKYLARRGFREVIPGGLRAFVARPFCQFVTRQALAVR
jgi:penicillin-insensitive murein DD-endopeptidase